MDFIRHFGLVPEAMWAFDRSREAKVGWDEYYKEIPQEVKDYGLKILDILSFNYEWINLGQCLPELEALKVQMKQAPLQVATSAAGGLCKCEHATEIYNIRDFIYDYDSNCENGSDGKVKLKLDYPIPWLMKIVVTEKKEVPPIQNILPLTKNLYFGQSDKEVIQLKKGLIRWEYIKTPINLTPFYGSITAEAVKMFQRDNKVGVLSILGINNGRSVLSGTQIAFNSLILIGK
jgi:hypothetical protein